MSQRPSEELQLILEGLALSQLGDICEISPEGLLEITQIKTRMTIERVRLNAVVTVDMVMTYLKEKYSDGPTGPVKTNSGL